MGAVLTTLLSSGTKRLEVGADHQSQSDPAGQGRRDHGRAKRMLSCSCWWVSDEMELKMAHGNIKMSFKVANPLHGVVD